jgi:hypothetical protein
LRARGVARAGGDGAMEGILPEAWLQELVSLFVRIVEAAGAHEPDAAHRTP